MNAAGETEVGSVFRQFEFTDYKWIDPADITVQEWVRMKCRYGCGLYCKRAGCPPNAPSIAECREFLHEYSAAALIHFQYTITAPVETTNNRYLNDWYRDVNTRLFEAEREVFFRNYYKAFAFAIGPCVYCAECREQPEACVNPLKVRPTPEGFGVDVFSLASRHGFQIRTLRHYNEPINSYALFLVE